MPETEISLKAFLLGATPAATISAAVGAATAALKSNVLDLPRMDWTQVAATLSSKVTEMFDIGLTDVLMGAWRDYQELRECADPAKHPADEAISLPMVDHTIESTLHPCLEIVIGARPPLRVTFEIALELELEGVILQIEGATLRSIRIGTCRGSGTLKCNGVVLAERETQELDLPGEIELAEGIRIEPPAAPRVVRHRESTSDATADASVPQGARIVSP